MQENNSSGKRNGTMIERARFLSFEKKVVQQYDWSLLLRISFEV